MADYSDAIRLDPKDAFNYSCRAIVWRKKHEREKEVVDLTEAIRLEPKNLDYRVDRASSWSAQGMHAKAMADFDEAVRLEPTNPRTYFYRGIEWQKDMNLDLAIADYTKAIQLDAKYTFGYRARADAWKLKREYAKAVQDYMELLRIEPDSAAGHKNLARLLSTCADPKIRDGKRAVAEATRACELTEWNDCACLDTLAAAYAEAGDFPTAVKWQTEAIKYHDIGSERALERGLGFEGRLAQFKRGQPARE